MKTLRDSPKRQVISYLLHSLEFAHTHWLKYMCAIIPVMCAMHVKAHCIGCLFPFIIAVVRAMAASDAATKVHLQRLPTHCIGIFKKNIVAVVATMLKSSSKCRPVE